MLAAMGHRMGLGQRQFERRFVAHWGMAPKQFEVIARMNSALGHALDTPGSAVSVAELAADEGYYDQSHMGRDVRRLAGHPLHALVQGARTPVSAQWPLKVGVQAQQALAHLQSDQESARRR